MDNHTAPAILMVAVRVGVRLIPRAFQRVQILFHFLEYHYRIESYVALVGFLFGDGGGNSVGKRLHFGFAGGVPAISPE